MLPSFESNDKMAPSETFFLMKRMIQGNVERLVGMINIREQTPTHKPSPRNWRGSFLVLVFFHLDGRLFHSLSVTTPKVIVKHGNTTLLQHEKITSYTIQKFEK